MTSSKDAINTRIDEVLVQEMGNADAGVYMDEQAFCQAYWDKKQAAADKRTPEVEIEIPSIEDVLGDMRDRFISTITDRAFKVASKDRR